MCSCYSVAKVAYILSSKGYECIILVIPLDMVTEHPTTGFFTGTVLTL